MVFGPTLRKYLPYLNFTVATSALVFQTTVLYPWHHELDGAFKELKKEHVHQLQIYHEVKLKKLEELEKRMVAQERSRERETQMGSVVRGVSEEVKQKGWLW